MTRVPSPRSSRQRQHSLLRRPTIAFSILVLVVMAAGWPGRFSSPSASFTNRQDSAWLSGSAHENLALLVGQVATQAPPVKKERLVYPYSVVPGGVQDPGELQGASAQDEVVSAHFAGFDFHRARVVRLDQPKMVYLSYRIGNRVFWTKKKVHLNQGEKLISDGKITARTRCGNQVSESVHRAISPQEPPTTVFDQPLEIGIASQIQFPSNFESALSSQRPFPGLDPAPAGPPNAGPFLTPPAGGWFPVIFLSGLPPAGCETPVQEKLEQQLGIMDDETKEKYCPTSRTLGPPPPPAPVPEPGTILLLSSGLAGIYFRYRRKSTIA